MDAVQRLDGAALDAILRQVLENHGTLRDVLAALAEHADFVIPGDVFREALERYGLSGVFLHLLQDPTVFNALAAIEAQAQHDTDGSGTRTLLAFDFVEPQKVERRMPLGTVKLYFAERVGVWIEENGDAVLRRGDISVGWLVFRENVKLRISQQQRDGALRDVLRISAGGGLSREVVLKPLHLPENLKPPAEGTAGT